MTLELSRPAEHAAKRQAQRAWVVLAAASCTALVAGLLLAVGGRWVYVHATRPEPATLRVVSGTGALWRAGASQEWTLITGERALSEGDQVSTALGTVLWITLFDGSTVEVTEDSIVTFDRMRSSRFTETTKHFVIDVERGIVYAALAPHGVYGYAELTVRSGSVSITTSDEADAGRAASFLFEVNAPLGAGQSTTYRTAVLRGSARVQVDDEQATLTANQQVRIDDNGVGATTEAIREFIRNGTFEGGLAGWQEFHDSAGASSATVSGEIEQRTDEISGHPTNVIELRREPPTEPMAQTGIRQDIGKTLRVYAGLQLSFDVRIDLQDPAGAGAQDRDFPLVVVLQYVDTSGEDRLWSRGYYIAADANRPIPHALGTQLPAGSWEHIVFDLRNLTPLPRQITSVVLYASGNGYRTRIANVSLTARELAEPGR